MSLPAHTTPAYASSHRDHICTFGFRHAAMQIAMGFVIAFIVIGCASTDVTNRRRYVHEPISKPDRIIFYNFAATPDDIPAGSSIAAQYTHRSTPQTPEEIEMGRQLGTLVASELVEAVRKMGMPAERAGVGPSPQAGDLLIKGAFVKIDAGSRLKRVIIGFGAGAGELQTHVVVYQMTERGPRLLGEGTLTASGGKMPGMLVPVAGGAARGAAMASAAVSGALNARQEMGPENLRGAAKRTAEEITKRLSRRFSERGWIPPDRAIE